MIFPYPTPSLVFIVRFVQVPADQLQLVIASNKSDLEDSRVVAREQAEAFSLKFNAFHVETSAKENVGIEELFKVLGTKVRFLQTALNLTCFSMFVLMLQK